MKETPVLQEIPEEQDGITIDLSELFWVLRRKWQILVIFTALGALLLGGYTRFFVEPTYKSTSKLYVVAASGDSMVDLTDLNIGTNLTNDYRELMLSYPVLDRVIKALRLDMKSQTLANMITLTNPQNTRVLSIEVESTDPQLSMEIANKVAEVAQEYLPETMGTVRPNVAQVARAATTRSGPNLKLRTLLGAFLGFFIVALIICIQHIIADAVGSPDDMEQITGMLPLCEIPETPNAFPEPRKFPEISTKGMGGHHS